MPTFHCGDFPRSGFQQFPFVSFSPFVMNWHQLKDRPSICFISVFEQLDIIVVRLWLIVEVNVYVGMKRLLIREIQFWSDNFNLCVLHIRTIKCSEFRFSRQPFYQFDGYIYNKRSILSRWIFSLKKSSNSFFLHYNISHLSLLLCSMFKTVVQSLNCCDMTICIFILPFVYFNRCAPYDRFQCPSKVFWVNKSGAVCGMIYMWNVVSAGSMSVCEELELSLVIVVSRFDCSCQIVCCECFYIA